MFQFERFVLENGLRVLVLPNKHTSIVSMNILYDVGAKDDQPNQTGFAHLFEHLMFGGSANIPNYHETLQKAGGTCKAYTTNDITNYHLQLPLKNIEVAFWLESDRMLSPIFTQKNLDLQRKVIKEEFKKYCVNKPYGDAWHHLRQLAYKIHPYQWPPIGRNLNELERIQLDKVGAFFSKHYSPINAIICVAGNVHVEQIKKMAEKWFADIPGGKKYVRQLPIEPNQEIPRIKALHADVPFDAIYKAWHINRRFTTAYYAADLITEILGSGFSSRLHKRLVKEQRIFNNILCYQTGSLDPGLLVIEGKIAKGKNIELASKEIDSEITKLLLEDIKNEELQKTKNKIEANAAFENMNIMCLMEKLALYELINNPLLINNELERYKAINIPVLMKSVKEVFRTSNKSELFYINNYI